MVIDAITNAVVFLIEELGIFAIGVTAIAWVARKAISQHFDRELNEYRYELEKDRLRYNKLHNERAEITANLYAKFVEFEEDLRTLVEPVTKPGDPSESDKLQDAADSGNEFLNFYLKNKIYFPPDVCETVEDLIDESMEIHNRRAQAMRLPEYQMESEDFESQLEQWKQLTDENVPELKRKLENHFRELLGVELSEQTTTD